MKKVEKKVEKVSAVYQVRKRVKFTIQFQLRKGNSVK